MTEPAATKRAITKRRRGATPETIADEHLRQERAYQLRMGCLTFQQIADSKHPADPSRTLYAGPSEARRGWLAALNRHSSAETTDSMRQEWCQRNEMVFRALMPGCLKADGWSIDRYTRLFAEHARMMGLNMPVHQVIEVITESTVDKAIAELEAQIDERSQPAG